MKHETEQPARQIEKASKKSNKTNGSILSARLFLSRIIKLLINSTLSLPHHASQASFLPTIMLRLICL